MLARTAGAGSAVPRSKTVTVIVPAFTPDGSTTTVYVALAGDDGSGVESMNVSVLPIDDAIIGAPFESTSMPLPPPMVEAEKRMNIRWLARPVNVTRPFVDGVDRSSVAEPPAALGVTEAVTSTGTSDAVSVSDPEKLGSGVIWTEYVPIAVMLDASM